LTRGHPSGSGLRNYRRTGLALILFAATTSTLMVTAPGGASATAAAFYPGGGTATAQPLAIKPSTAGLGYTMTLAGSSAQYAQGLAKALSQTLTLGAIGTSLTTASCGKPATIQASSLPQPASVESSQGPPSQTLTVAGTFNGSGAGAGIEQASVTKQPSATATTKGGDMNVVGAFDMSGLQSMAQAQVVNGQTRAVQATSDVGEISLLGGLIVMKGMHWEAAQQTGAANTSSASFSLGTMVVGGVPVPTATPAQLATAIGIVNTALAPSGFHITLPQVIQTPDTHDGNGSTTQVTDLSIGIDNSALGAAVVGSQLATAQPLRTAIDKAIIGANCSLGEQLVIGDIILGVPAGGGGLDFNFGSATVNISADAPVNAFGNFGLAGANSGPTDTGGSTGSFTPGDAGSPSIAGTPGTDSSGGSPTSSAASSGTTGSRSLGATKASACHSLSEAGGGCSGGGAALPIGIAALIFLLATFAWDLVRQRRRRLTTGKTL
jgi:hypothetical protein